MIAKKHHRFSVDDYERMIKIGMLTENDRVELIRGEVVKKMSIGDKHLACVNRLTRLFIRMLGDRAIVSVQNPVRLQSSELEPDLALLNPKEDDYASGKPRAGDVLLIVEVADTSQEYDRDVKMPLYAENGVCEFWLVDVVGEKLEVYRQPHAKGRYGSTQILSKGQKVTIEEIPGAEFEVAELLP